MGKRRRETREKFKTKERKKKLTNVRLGTYVRQK